VTDQRQRNRLVLLLLAALFAAPLVAAVLLHAIGWEPSKTRNHGTLLQPPIDLRELPPLRADGSRYEWAPQDRRWRLVVVAPGSCAPPARRSDEDGNPGAEPLTSPRICHDLIASLDKVWQLQGRKADRLDVLWFGEVPAGAAPFRRFVPMRMDSALVSQLPDAQPNERGEPPLFLIDPSGYLAMRYAPGADVAGVREDIARLLK
jgi:hypothetical protein